MTTILLVLLLPIVLALAAVYAVVQLTALLLRVVFLPVVWLNGRPTRQRIELYHYDSERRSS